MRQLAARLQRTNGREHKEAQQGGCAAHLLHYIPLLLAGECQQILAMKALC